MRKKTKVFVIMMALLLVIPLTIFTIVEESGFFDTRSSASDSWESCGYSKADLDGDGEVGLSDFHIWSDLWKEYKACGKDVSKCMVGCVESMHSDQELDVSKTDPLVHPCSEDRNVRDFNAEYVGGGSWSYTISGQFRNGCLSSSKNEEISIDDSSGNENVSITVIVDDVSGNDMQCITAMIPFSKSGTFRASQDAVVSCFVQTVQGSQKVR